MVRTFLSKLLSWCPLWRTAVGGYWHYQHVQSRRYTPEQFRSCGADVDIGAGVFIRAPERMKIGRGVFIGSDCYIDALGGLQLGDCCALASNATILTVDHHFRDAQCLPWDDVRIIKPVVVGDYAWIGKNACILPGVRIGEGAILGLGAVVPKDVPPRAIVVGNPARIVGHRDEEQYNSLKKAGATRTASTRCSVLWVPPEMREKYHDLLQEVGYDVDGGREYFEFKSSDA